MSQSKNQADKEVNQYKKGEWAKEEAYFLID